MKRPILYITGCDWKTEWMLPWFLHNFEKHNSQYDLWIYDFGMSAEMKTKLTGYNIKDLPHRGIGWFNKPAAMLDAAQYANKVCWLDTDCQVVDFIRDIFDRTKLGMLTIAVDGPWTRRRQEMWHNTGVVVFGTEPYLPPVLINWAEQVKNNPHPEGDQTVLHLMLGPEPLQRLVHIYDLPQRYNVLRLDFVDGTFPKDERIAIKHWTGPKGKEEIRRQMNEL
jgi:hypothetical protein